MASLRTLREKKIVETTHILTWYPCKSAYRKGVIRIMTLRNAVRLTGQKSPLNQLDTPHRSVREITNALSENMKATREEGNINQKLNGRLLTSEQL